MPNQQQPQPPDQLGSITTEARQQSDVEATREVVARIRDAAGLPGDADDEVLQHYHRRVDREYGRRILASLFDEWLELAETIPDDAERFARVQRIEQIRDQEMAWLPTISARMN